MSRSTTPDRPAFLQPSRHSAAVIVTGVVAVLAVVAFGLVVAKTAAMTTADLGLSTALNGLHTGVIGTLATGVYTVFSPVEAIAITVVIAAIIWIASRSFRTAITFGVVVGVTWVPSALVKALVHRPRPDAGLLPHPFANQPTDASFPSGHMVFVAALVVAFVLLSRGRAARPVIVVVGTLLIAVVAFALVIDGVHYPSDVVASLVWSVGLAPLVLHVWNRLVIPLTDRRRRALERTPA